MRLTGWTVSYSVFSAPIGQPSLLLLVSLLCSYWSVFFAPIGQPSLLLLASLLCSYWSALTSSIDPSHQSGPLPPGGILHICPGRYSNKQTVKLSKKKLQTNKQINKFLPLSSTSHIYPGRLTNKQFQVVVIQTDILSKCELLSPIKLHFPRSPPGLLPGAPALHCF